MNTYEARAQMRQLALDALVVVEHMQEQRRADRASGNLRILASEARSLLADAGYPGEGAWRALQRASIGLDTAGLDFDAMYWESVRDDLQTATDGLDSLLGANVARDTDVYIVD